MVSAVEPDLEITLNRHFDTSKVSRNSPTRSGSTLSRTNSRGMPSGRAMSWKGLERAAWRARLPSADPPIPRTTTFSSSPDRNASCMDAA